MYISDNTPGKGPNYANTLVSELLAYGQAYNKAKEKTSEENPFLQYNGGGSTQTLTFFDSPTAAKKNASQALYIVAPDNPMETFSLIKRKVVKNDLRDLPKDIMRQALGTLLDNA
jgi:hypothetical protein